MYTQITINVDAATALAYMNASAKEKDSLAQNVRSYLTRSKEEKLLELSALMETVSSRAKELGLTEEELEKILKEEN